MRQWSWLCAGVCLLQVWSIAAQVPGDVDTLAASPLFPLLEVVELSDITVEALAVGPAPKMALRVEEKALRRFGSADFTPALNRLPGVRLETRAPGSYRVLIRGTGRRSPFGVRDVRVYWNGLPLTEPGGDTPLNFVDPENTDRVTVGKGPFAVATGNALGGVLALTSSPRNGSTVAGQGGSFGQKAVHLRYGQSSSTGSLDVRFTHRDNDGYRDWSNFRRTTGQLSHSSTRQLKDQTVFNQLTTATHLLATRLDYQLPGALTPTEFADNPRQARANSAATDASIDYETVLVGTRIVLDGAHWQLAASPYLTGFRFDNPFNVNHKRETNVGFGAVYAASYRFSDQRPVLTFGGESQVQFRDARQYDVGLGRGRPGALQFSDDIQTERLMHYVKIAGTTAGFGESGHTRDQGKIHYEAGLSLTDVRYNVERTFERGAEPPGAVSDFKPFLAPSLSVNYLVSEVDLGLRAARGSSPPTLREFRTNEGTLDVDLAPEVGTSVELSLRHRLSPKLSYSAAGYLTALSQTITTYQDSSQVQRFRNSGKATQPGLEVAASWFIVQNTVPMGRLRELELAPSYSYQPYRYTDYAVAGVSFAGRPMPGLPEHALDLLLSGGYGWGNSSTGPELRVDLNARYESVNPLNDAGSVEAAAFWLFRVQLALAFGLRQNPTDALGRPYSAFIAVDNVTDTRYSLGNDINPEFGNRYFQAAPGRSVVLGFRVGF